MEGGIKNAPAMPRMGFLGASRGMAKANLGNEPQGNQERRPGENLISDPHSDHIMAVGGGGSLGSPALVSGKKISKAASITNTAAPRR